VKVSQADVPAYSLDDALRVPRAIADHYGFKPTKPLNVAAGMGMQPNSGGFRMLAGAAIAYGLTSGGPNAPQIAITPLGMRIVRPTAEADDLHAKREALLKPRVIGEFLRKYADAPIPREDIGINVLQDLGAPKDRAKAIFELILAGAASVGLIKEIRSKKYISLEGVATGTPTSDADSDLDEPNEETVEPPLKPPPAATVPVLSSDIQRTQKRVYVTHGKNRAFVDPIKKLLAFGELEPVVSVERPSVSQPVPDKIMNEMRSCGAAIIHVDAELKLLDASAGEHLVLNPNVLMEIGAAMALYGRRFILLVRDGIKLPSNLQGLFEVRYSGDGLDGDATVRLLESIRDIKNHPMPDRYSTSTP
jgi:predicted nucleotide-binding protein